jgi:hypothetical protein
MATQSRPLDVAVIVHPPERRRRRSSVIAAQACCCCCCCCCLHTVGGLIGGLVGSLLPVPLTRRPREYDDDNPFRRDDLPPTFTVPAALIYWGLVSLGTMGTFLALALSSGTGRVSSAALLFAGFVLILILPVVQLAAFLVAMIAVALCPQTLIPDKAAAVVRVAYIGLWSFVGTIAGLGAMFLVCMLLPVFQR